LPLLTKASAQRAKFAKCGQSISSCFRMIDTLGVMPDDVQPMRSQSVELSTHQSTSPDSKVLSQQTDTLRSPHLHIPIAIYLRQARLGADLRGWQRPATRRRAAMRMLTACPLFATLDVSEVMRNIASKQTHQSTLYLFADEIRL
jgi:hypothetical protein